VTDTHSITGFTSDLGIRDQMASYARDLSPVQDNDGRLAYASLLLAWVLQGSTKEIRRTRVKAVEQAAHNHMGDRTPKHGLASPDYMITYPDFMVEVEKFLEFLS
jgi:hypothetical protein